MWTIKYRGYWIHGYVDRDDVRVQSPEGRLVIRSKSLGSAKRRVAKMIKGGDQ
jgi:hypothetical protein